MARKVVKPKILKQADNHTAHEKRVWDHQVTKIMKTEHMLENNLLNIFSVLMSLCNSNTKIQINYLTEYPDVEAELDTVKLLGMVKKLIHTRGTSDLNKSHNRAMAHRNLINLHQDMFHDIQDFHDQYIEIKKVCSELGLKFGRFKEHPNAILKDKGIRSQANNKLISHLTN